MDPITIQSAQSVVLRPTGTSDELARILQRGQVVAGEVLQSSDDGRVLLALGRQKIAAQSAVRLEPGQRFEFVVVEADDGVALKIVDSNGATEDSELLRALRRVMSTAEPVGERLTELRDVLAKLEPPAGSAFAKLLAALGEHVWRPGLGPEELARLFETSGTSYEAHLFDEVLQSSSPRELERAAENLWAGLFSELGGPSGDLGRDPQGFLAKLADALWRVVSAAHGFDESAPRAAVLQNLDLAAFARDLKTWLGRALGALGNDPTLQRALARLAAVDFESWTREERLLFSRALLGSALAPALARDPSRLRARLAGLLADLKSELLAARDAAPEGAARQAIERTLATLESEQLLNLARAEGGEPRHWSLPLLDGQRFATLDLTYRRQVERREDGHEAEPSHRLSFSVDFTHTGPVRADLLARTGQLSVRVAVVDPRVLARLREDLAELEARLATGGRAVHVALVPAAPEEVRVRPSPDEIRFLREHHVMDLQG